MSGSSSASSCVRSDWPTSSRAGRIITAGEQRRPRRGDGQAEARAAARPARDRSAKASHSAQMAAQLNVYSATWKLPGSARAAPTRPSRPGCRALGRCRQSAADTRAARAATPPWQPCPRAGCARRSSPTGRRTCAAAMAAGSLGTKRMASAYAPPQATRLLTSSSPPMLRGVMPATKNGQLSGYHAPTCRSARNGKPLNRYGVQNGRRPACSSSRR